jgi:hypothetical protein
MTKDTTSSLSIHRAVGKKWEMILELPHGLRAEIGKFLDDMCAVEVGKKYTDDAAYHFYVALDMPDETHLVKPSCEKP